MTERRLDSVAGGAIVPPMDIFESEDGYLLVTDLPGVGAEAVSVKLDEGVLAIEADRVEMGIAYRREVDVPAQVDPTLVTADLVGGVLTVSLPRLAAAKAREVPISIG